MKTPSWVALKSVISSIGSRALIKSNKIGKRLLRVAEDTHMSLSSSQPNNSNYRLIAEVIPLEGSLIILGLRFKSNLQGYSKSLLMPFQIIKHKIKGAASIK
jgi:hypothetical protein